MGLDTMHDREFYLAKTEEYPLLAEAIEGTATFRGRLDDLVGMITGREGAPPETAYPGEDFSTYLTMLEDISSAGLDVKGLAHSGLDMSLYGTGRAVTRFFLGIGALGAIGLLIPPLATIEAVALCVGGTLGGFFGNETKKYKKLRKKAQEIFAPAYKAAEAVDAGIGKCFILEHFADTIADARPRFEETYRTLSGEEREAVDAQLYAFLGAGGITSMDENQLKEYLGGLLVPKVEGDA